MNLMNFFFNADALWDLRQVLGIQTTTGGCPKADEKGVMKTHLKSASCLGIRFELFEQNELVQKYT